MIDTTDDAMRIGIVSRFPLAEATRWKQELITGLINDGHEVFLVFGKRSPVDHAKEAVRRATSHKGSRDIRLLMPWKSKSRAISSPETYSHGTDSQGTDSHRKAPVASAHEVPQSVEKPKESSKTKRLATFAKERKLVVQSFPSVNSSAALTFVTEQKPDLLILAGAEIVRSPLLTIPQLGALNPHYGPLPAFRGMSAQEWCLFSKIQPAVTIHFVTTGIDTGDIVSVTPLPLRPTDSWVDVRQHCQDVARDALLSAVSAIATETVTTKKQSLSDGSQYFSMHPRLMHRAKRNLESGYWLASAVSPHTLSPQTLSPPTLSPKDGPHT